MSEEAKHSMEDFVSSSATDVLSAKVAQQKSLDGQTMTVKGVEWRDFDSGAKPVLTVAETEYKVPLNKSNAKALAQRYGTDETKWAGKRFMLLVVDKNFQNETVPGLLLKPVDPAQGQAQLGGEGAQPSPSPSQGTGVCRNCGETRELYRVTVNGIGNYVCGGCTGVADQ